MNDGTQHSSHDGNDSGNSAGQLDLLGFPLRARQLIEASAGTGKTYTLAALYLRLVLGHGNADADGSGFGRALIPPEIVVMTFTNAATQELRDRIRARLAAAAALFGAGEDDGAVTVPADAFLYALRAEYPRTEWPLCARRLALAAEWMDEAAVFTIHGWCNRLLGDHAFVSGHLFSQALVGDQSELLREAVRDYWRSEIVPLPAAACALLAECWSTPDALYQHLHAPLRQRALLTPAAPPAEVLARCVAELAARKAPWPAWADELEALFAAACSTKAVDGRRLNAKYYGSWLERLRAWAAAPHLIRPELSEAAWKRLTPAGLQEAWKEPAHAPAEHPALQALADLRAAPDAKGWLREPLLRHAAHAVAARFAAMQRRRAEIGFDDLLTALDATLQGPHGAALAAQIRARYPVALVDEFQDTDPVQYRIFNAVYAPEHAADTALILIGDPKQAIYGFRGADFYTYLAAREASDIGRHTLRVNYRSTRAMVNAVNACFRWADAHAAYGAFGLGQKPGQGAEAGQQRLPFVPAVAQGLGSALEEDGQVLPALTLAELPAPEQGKPLGKGAYVAAAAAHAAARIAELLAAARAGRAGFRAVDGAWRPLRPGDMAVLVNTGSEARTLRHELSARGVRSVYLSERDSVYAAPQAAELEFWLAACAAPDDVRAVRAALATPLLALDWATLAELESDEFALEARVQQFRGYRELWRRQGVLAAVQHLLHDFAVPARLLAPDMARQGGERMLTDVLHLAELLQQAAGELDGEYAVLRHLANLRQEPGSHEAHIRRLESDADLVQVVTVHKSKGLEYPLVFLPFACTAFDVNKTVPPLLVHDDRGRARLRFDTERDTLARLARERRAEDLRKLYVALTRACHACWLSVADVATGTPGAAWNYLLAGAEDAAYGTRLAALAASCADIQHVSLPAGATVVPLPPDAAGQTRGAARTAPRRVAHSWWVASYSALKTAEAGAMSSTATSTALAPDTRAADSAREATFREDHEPAAAPVLPAGDGAPRRPAVGTLHAFPRGAEAGTLLHDLLEWTCSVGFAAARADAARLRDVIARRCARRGWERWIDVVHGWLEGFLATPWPVPAAAPVTLAALPAGQVVAELEFWFAVHHADATRLDALVSAHTLAGRPRPPLAAQTLNGMLKGFIDLIFAHEGRYYVADYKSNALGVADDDYTPEAMQAEMAARRYDLQLALYLLALHRHLRARLPGYDYERHIGGALYWFLRGGACHVERPPQALIEALDAVCAGMG